MKIVKKCEYVKNLTRLKLMKIVKKLYENSEISLDREFSALHKTHENREKNSMKSYLLYNIEKIKLTLVFLKYFFLFCM